MRLKSIYISQYKNLKDFHLSFEGAGFIDIFVGKNGSGKSNLFEAIIKIFHHLYEDGKINDDTGFNYAIKYEINNVETEIAWNDGKLKVDDKDRATIGKTPLPDNVLIYYSGHNKAVPDLVGVCEENFRKKVKAADIKDSRRFIGIGPEYKELLLVALLIQPATNVARQYIRHKLGISKLGIKKPGTTELTEPVIKIVLQRPTYAARPEFNIENNDQTDRYWKPLGITKDFLDRLHKCISNSPGGLTVSEGYFPSENSYILYLDIKKVQQEFSDFTPQDLFRQFDNLKTLDMLREITIPLQLDNGVDATISHFSDGQFQSVYIYSIVELFKDRNCITLLDEPDSFLHPEWQFDFLKQVFEITDTTAKNNHVLMSSHSASTITTVNESVINLFELDGNKVAVTRVTKADIIKSLSAGLISFSESEARLNIHHVLKNTSGAVLFTEGITDEMILETAWLKLYPTEDRNFEIQSAFSCGFMRNLMKDKMLYQNNPGRKFFSLFDFDEAYSDWNQLGKDIQTDPSLCLTKKHNDYESYALLLPVPASDPIRDQAINPHGGNFGDRSLLTIELLFHGAPGLETYFTVDNDRPGGFTKFIGDGKKVKFAKEIVPTLGADSFEVFRPMFEFIKSKCSAAM